MRFLTVCLLEALPCAAQQGFYPFAVDQDRLSGAPDFSFLNQPITAKDRVVVREDKRIAGAGNGFGSGVSCLEQRRRRRTGRQQSGIYAPDMEGSTLRTKVSSPILRFDGSPRRACTTA